MPGCLPVVTCLRPVSDSFRSGLNGRAAQPSARNGLVALALPPRAEWKLAPTSLAEQSDGLSMNPGRSILTVTDRTRNGMPCQIVGNGSETTDTSAVDRSTHTA